MNKLNSSTRTARELELEDRRSLFLDEVEVGLAVAKSK